MSSAPFDIFKEDPLGNALWIAAAVVDPKTAQRRLNELASVVPGEYFVVDQRTSRVVESVGRHFPAYTKSANSKIWNRRCFSSSCHTQSSGCSFFA